MKFLISASTDIGSKKPVNQDSLFVRRLSTAQGEMAFAVLCDGVGGLKHGEIASTYMTKAFSDWMYDRLRLLSRTYLEDHVIRTEWEAVVGRENSRIIAAGSKLGCRIGTTVTALLLTQSRFYLLNIGDTRAYQIDSSGVKQLTEDHTLAEREVKRGNLRPDQVDHSPISRILTKCVGVEKTITPDLFYGDIGEPCLYLLCSDGFRHKITQQEMYHHFYETDCECTEQMKSQEALLIERNIQRGETDNISVITIKCW